MAELNGTWIYQSFRPNAGPPMPLVPWAPPSKLSVTTDATGEVEGKLAIPLPAGSPVPELVLTITGRITPSAAGLLPEGIELTGTVGESVSDIRGYFISDSSSPLVVGTVTAVKNDPGKQPNGTHGPFVLRMIVNQEAV
jgi:hypothetical protein